jgi:hypothetical protein
MLSRNEIAYLIITGNMILEIVQRNIKFYKETKDIYFLRVAELHLKNAEKIYKKIREGR